MGEWMDGAGAHLEQLVALLLDQVGQLVIARRD